MSEELSAPQSDNALAFIENPDASALQAVLAEGNIQKLSTPQRLQFLAAICKSTGLNPLTRPFEFITLNGKIAIYARKDATDQLRKIHNVSVEIIRRDTVDGVHIVTVRATMATGRQDESIGALDVSKLKGDALATAYMKCETKAKRRVTLSICGLGFLDESEVEAAHPRKEATGAVHDPWEPIKEQAPVIESPQDEPPAWTDLYPKGWREWLDSTGQYPENARELLGAWNKDRNNPGLCAHGALWIEQNIPVVDQLSWDEIQQEVEGLPDMVHECTPEQLFKCYCIVGKKVKAQEAKQ